MRVAIISAVLGSLAVLPGCGKSGKSDLERRYEQVQTGMTEEQVADILGQGRVVTAAELATYAEYPKFDPKEFPPETKWVQWDGNLQYVLAGFSDGKLVVCQLVGAEPPEPRQVGSGQALLPNAATSRFDALLQQPKATYRFC